MTIAPGGPRRLERGRRPRNLAVAAAAFALAMAVLSAACGSSDATDDPAPSTGSGSAAGDADLAAVVSDLTEPQASYPIPTEPVDGVSTLSGKTVYYIPITQQAPQFAVTGSALTEALGAAGIDVQICNGNANPSDVTACVNQATGANAGAIVTDAVPYALAANAFEAAQAKNIPVLITDQIPDPAHPAGPVLGYLESSGTKGMVALADWIIVDSGGSATVVVNGSTDTPSTQAYVAAAQEEFATRCPDCRVTWNKISSANFSLIASSTSSAILANPGVDYVISEFEQYLQPTSTGVQQSGRAASIRGASNSRATQRSADAGSLGSSCTPTSDRRRPTRGGPTRTRCCG